MSNKNKNNDKPSVQKVKSLLNAQSTLDLKKQVEKEMQEDLKSLSTAELIERSVLAPMISLEPNDPEEDEKIARKKEGNMIDKLDGGMGAVL
tara:strand:- start:135 stop:410 length:276 start_codon:yes stop_codon:yes gene_type:complete